ncbi:MAG: hypothetical protein COU69_04775 [Candidatus Pacebacteria bacterium CG10_big_fil_rev_8_21_14_0_10_56_10]|nr:MAG: hypothetical protein COU69_04775 [Candidatus Pacebacteria bacterium CG10_big_fil_rev_8_21_14_0_10_56_10]
MAPSQVPPPQTAAQPESPPDRAPWARTIFLSLAIAFGLLTVTGLLVAGWGYHQLRAFAEAAGTTPGQVIDQARRGLTSSVTTTANRKNILILGTDQLAQRGQTNPLTDTMLLVSVDLASAKVTTVPFPRDLWSSEYKTKINALLFYGNERTPNQPELFPTSYLESISGIDIHHTLVISLGQVSSVIDQLGGVEVIIDESFTDTQFPNTEVDVTVERDPAKLYTTVSFQAGRELMSGRRALEYIRSRHSNGQTGTDVNRSRRQQAVIEALLRRLTSPTALKDAELMGRLYRQYLDEFDQYLPVTQVIATGRELFPVRDQLSFTASQFTIFPEEADGVLVHPAVGLAYNNQWVYIIRDADAFQQEIARLLN